MRTDKSYAREERGGWILGIYERRWAPCTV